MRALPPVARLRAGVFTSAEASAAGWTRKSLEHGLRTGRLLRLQRGVWCDATDLAAPAPGPAADLLLVRRAVAAALVTRGGIVSHLAAARLDGLPVWAPAPRACITLTQRTRGVTDRVHTHRAAVREGRMLHDIVHTTTVRTILDITREHGVEAGLVTADAALHSGEVTLDDLVAGVAAAPPAPGRRRLVDLLTLVDGRAESPLESRSRWHMREHAVPPPRPQVVIRTRDGRVLGRVDFFWADGVVGEVDGNVKYRRDGDRDDEGIREKWRQEFLERTGLLVVRWGARDLLDFAPVARLIADRRERVRRPGWPCDWVATPT